MIIPDRKVWLNPPLSGWASTGPLTLAFGILFLSRREPEYFCTSIQLWSRLLFHWPTLQWSEIYFFHRLQLVHRKMTACCDSGICVTFQSAGMERTSLIELDVLYGWTCVKLRVVSMWEHVCICKYWRLKALLSHWKWEMSGWIEHYRHLRSCGR